MSILAVNLKHLYQRRGAWFWHFIILAQTPALLLPIRAHTVRYLGYLIVSLLMGVLAGGLQKDILTKPFSFCLPNHRRIPRAFIFWIGGVINLFLGCVFMSYPGLGFPYVLLVVLASSFVGMTAYFYGVYASLQAVPSPAVGILGVLIPYTIFFAKWDIVLQSIIIDQPIVVILLCALVCVWVWRMLGRDCLARKYCGKLIMGMFDSWNRTKIEKYKQARADRNMTESKVKFFENTQEFFLGKMERYGFLSRGRYVWGNIYMVFGKLFGLWNIWHVLGFLGTTIFLVMSFGIIGPSENDKRIIGILFIMPAFSVFSIDLTPYRTVLFPAGRRDKYYSTLILSAVITLLAGLLVLAITGISVLLETMLPEFSFRGELILSYYGMDIGDFYIYWLFMPVTLSLAVTFPRTKPWFIIVLVAVFMQGWVISKIVLKQSLVDLIGPVSIAGLIALCWICFLVVLYYVCMRRCLVGQVR